MNSMSIICRVSFTLAKDRDFGGTVGLDLDVNLGSFTIIFGFGPHFVRTGKKIQSMLTTTTFL